MTDIDPYKSHGRALVMLQEAQARLAEAERDAARWRKCKTLRKSWWIAAMEIAGMKGGKSLDEQIDAVMAADSASRAALNELHQMDQEMGLWDSASAIPPDAWELPTCKTPGDCKRYLCCQADPMCSADSASAGKKTDR